MAWALNSGLYRFRGCEVFMAGFSYIAGRNLAHLNKVATSDTGVESINENFLFGILWAPLLSKNIFVRHGFYQDKSIVASRGDGRSKITETLYPLSAD